MRWPVSIAMERATARTMAWRLSALHLGWAFMGGVPWEHDESGRDESRPYEDIPGFCKSATLDEIRKHGHVLTPGRYVGSEAAEDDGEPFADKMQRLSAQWREQQHEAARLDAAIEANLKELGYGA